MTRPLEFWFEFASTYSYPAAMRIEAACDEAGVPLVWKPFLLGPVFAAQGLQTSPFIENPIKGRYMWRDLERICANQELRFQRPSVFPRGSLLAARIATAFAHTDWIGSFVRAVYSANFADDRDISDDGVIRELIGALGQNPDAVIEAATQLETKAALRSATERAQECGIFGAPSFMVGDELFWGHDRMAAALRWAR